MMQPTSLILGQEIKVVQDRWWTACFGVAALLIFMAYVLGLIGHIFTLALVFVHIAIMSAQQGRVQNKARDFYLDQIQIISCEIDIVDAKIEESKKFDQYYSGAVTPGRFGSIYLIFIFVASVAASYPRILQNISYSGFFFDYIVSALLSGVFAIILLLMFFASLCASAVEDVSKFVNNKNYSALAHVIEENELDDVLIHNKRNLLDRVKSRAETLTNESVLFSALSFSAFLGIVLADKIKFSDIFINDYDINRIFLVLEALVRGRLQESGINIFNEIRDASVTLISLSMLLCSIFFLCSIIARTRFNDRFHDVESLVKAAEWLNVKEEALSGESHKEQRDRYKSAILGIIESVDEIMISIKVPVAQMKIFRIAGISCFVLAGLFCANMFNTTIFLACTLVVSLSLLVEIGDGMFQYFRKGFGLGENGLLRLFGIARNRTE